MPGVFKDVRWIWVSLARALYVIEQNKEIIYTLKSLNKNSKKQFIYIYGESGSGKSHISISSCKYVNKNNLVSTYIPLNNQEIKPEILENTDQMFLLCIDNLEKIIGIEKWEKALFNCFNYLLESEKNLLITSTKKPNELNYFLPDLKSRMCSCLSFQLHSPDDNQKLIILNIKAKLKELNLPSETAKFLLNHYNRNLKELINNLDIISKKALQEKHQLTIPFIKTILKTN